MKANANTPLYLHLFRFKDNFSLTYALINTNIPYLYP